MKTKFHGLFHGFICEFYLKKKLIKTKGVFMHLECKQNFTIFFLFLQTFVLKEGVKFRIRIEFVVQREIVTGLKYVQRTTRKSVPVDKMVHMVGSYAPKAEAHQYLTPFEDAPSGMLGRGTYRVTSCFTDDYKNEHLKVKLTLQNSKEKKIQKKIQKKNFDFPIFILLAEVYNS